MPPPVWWVRTTELSTGRVGTARNALGPRDYSRRFRVIVNDRRVGPVEVSGAPGIPYLWSPYTSYLGGEGDPQCPCVSLPAEQEDHGEGEFFSWIVTAIYSTDLGMTQPQGPGSNNPTDPNSPQNNPELDYPEIEWTGETMQRAFPVDLDGRPYTNSARVPFKPAISVERGFRVFVYTRNELFFDTLRAERYTYALNEDNFMGAAPGMVQCLQPNARAVFGRGRPHWRVTYKFRFFPTLPQVRITDTLFNGVLLDTITWQPHVLDAGRTQMLPHPLPPRAAAGWKVQVPIMDGMQRVTEDKPLNGQGLKADTQTVAGVTAFTPTYIKFKSYPLLPFADLMIRL
jgi:hypothetical protein